MNTFAPEILRSNVSLYFLTNAIFGLIGITLIDKLGRRTLMMSSLFGMAFSLAGIGLGLGWPCALTYIASFSIGMSGPPYILPSELFGKDQREIGIMLVSLTSWGTNSIVSFAFPGLMAHIGVTTIMWIFAFSCTIGWLFIFRMGPETRGLSLLEIETRLSQNRPLRTIGD
jgi:MFS family permease